MAATALARSRLRVHGRGSVRSQVYLPGCPIHHALTRGGPTNGVHSLRSIGIDEISHQRGQKYLTVVVDHHTGRLVWAAPGRDRQTVLRFFDALGEERCKQIESVSCDMAGWIASAVAERVPHAERCVDPFHVIQLATDALDEVRRELWREARKEKNLALAKDLKGARFCVWKNPEKLTERQQAKLASIQKLNGPLYRAYLLKEQLRQIYKANTPEDAEQLLDSWLAWARRCRLPPFMKLARTIKAQRDGILAAVRLGLSNARVEQINTQIRLITRRAYGFHSAQALIALAMLTLSGLCPALPDRG